jgi:hypothetical protein
MNCFPQSTRFCVSGFPQAASASHHCGRAGGLTCASGVAVDFLRRAALVIVYFSADIQVVLVCRRVNPEAVFKASLVVFNTKYHLLFFSLARTELNGTATFFRPYREIRLRQRSWP